MTYRLGIYKKDEQTIVHGKAWGEEVWIHNENDYCGKILRFYKKGAKFSMHFHLKKSETWYVNKGSFQIRYVETDTATTYEEILEVGDIVEIPPGAPHQLIALEDNSEIFEISTEHFEDDSYRVEKGDSQL